MITLKIKNYSNAEKQTLANALTDALLSLPCDLDKDGYCKDTNCVNYKICYDLAKAHCFVCKSIDYRK